LRKNQDKSERARNIVRISLIVAAGVLIAYVLFMNFNPFNATVVYKTNFGNNSKLVTMERPFTPITLIGKGDDGSIYEIPMLKMKTEQVSFTLHVPYTKIKSVEFYIKYKGDPEEFLVNFGNISDPSLTRPIENKSLYWLRWDRVESNGLALFQKRKKFRTIPDFLNALPELASRREGAKEIKISSYYYDLAQPADPRIDERKVNTGTSINNTLRGPHTFYVFVKDKPLKFSFYKQELNMFESPYDPDTLTVTVSKGDERLFTKAIPGDEVMTNEPSKPVKENIEVRGLNPGVYKVDFVCNMDVVVKNLKFAQRYVVLDGKVFISDNKIHKIGPTKGATLYTNSNSLGIEVWHQESFQRLMINDSQKVTVDFLGHKDIEVENFGELNKIEVERGSLIISSQGRYFAFSNDSYFNPKPLDVLPFSENIPLEDLDYIIARYTNPIVKKGWKETNLSVDFPPSTVAGKYIRVTLISPGIENTVSGELLISSMRIKLIK